MSANEETVSFDGRVDEAIAEYVHAAETGQPFDPESFLARYPDLADELREFLSDQGRFQAFAGDVLLSVMKRAMPGGAPIGSRTPDSPYGGAAPGRPGGVGNPGVAISSIEGAATGDSVRRFGDYELLHEIARGGMGVVYKARQTSLNRLVAVKVIRSGQLADSEEVQRFRTEAEAAAQLDHPGIVPIFEVGQHEGHHFFSMGYVDGRSLSGRLTEGPLPPREAAELLRIVAEAVEYAHERGVIHRDLKPANILLDARGQPRVTDFGLAKLTGNAAELTGTGQILGTPGYMPPEQAAAQGAAVGKLSDVYSLGATLYCLLTGRPPFHAANPLETLLQVQRQEPVAPRQLNPAVPQDLDTIVLKCLDKSPARRYASAKLLGEELGRFLEGRPILARPVGRIERFWRWCRREPLVSALCGAVAVALLAGTIVSSYFGWKEGQRAESETQARLNEGLQTDEARKQTRIAREQAGIARQKTALAEQSLKEEQRQRGIADEKTKLANEAKIKEAEQAELARRRAKELKRALYLSDMNRIEEYAKVPNHERMISLLTRHIPQVDGEEDLRGFDWYYWWKQTHGDGQTLTLGAPVRKVAVAADGAQVAVACEGGRIDLYDIPSGKRSHTLQAAPKDWASVSFSDEGTILNAVGADGVMLAWDTIEGKLKRNSETDKSLERTFPTRMDTIPRWPAAISRDGRTFVAPDPSSRGIAFWRDPSTWEGLVELSNGYYIRRTGGKGAADLMGHPSKFVFKPPFFVGMVQSPTTNWRAGDRAAPKPEEQGAPVFGLAFSNSGKLFVDGNRDGEVRIWNSGTHELVRRCAEHTGIVWSVAFSGDDRSVASAGNDGQVIVWDAETGARVCRCAGHSGPVRCVTFLPGDARIASTGDDGTVRIWDARSGTAVDLLRGHTGRVSSVVAFGSESTPARLLTGGEDGTARVWSLTRTNALVARDSSPLLQAASSSDGTWIAAIDVMARGIHVFDAASGLHHRTLRPKSSLAAWTELPATKLAFVPGRPWLATAHFTDVVVWNVETGQDVFRAQSSELSTGLENIQCVAVSTDGRKFASGSDNGKVRSWDLETRKPLPTLEFAVRQGDAQRRLSDVKFLADGSGVLTTFTIVRSGNRTAESVLRRFDAEKETSVLKTKSIRSTAVSHAGGLVAILGSDGAQLFNDLSGEPVATLSGPLEDRNRIGNSGSVAFSTDGKRLLLVEPVVRLGKTIVADKLSVRLFDVEQRKEIGAALVEGAMASACFAAHDESAAIVTSRGGIDLWDFRDPAPRRSLSPPAGTIHSLCLSADGSVLAAGLRVATAFNPVQQDSDPCLFRLSDGTQFSRPTWLSSWSGPRPLPFTGFLDPQLLLTEKGNVLRISPQGRSVSQSPMNLQLTRGTGSRPYIALSPDTKRAAVQDLDAAILVLKRSEPPNAANWFEPETRLAMSHKAVRRGVFSPQSDRIAFAADDVVEIRDFSGGAPIEFRGHEGAVHGVAWSADESALASCGDDGTVRVWDVAATKERVVLRGHAGAVLAVAFPSDGLTVISGGADGAILVWDLATGEVRLRLSGHRGAVNQLLDASDRGMLFSGGDDGVVRIWRTSTSREPGHAVPRRHVQPSESAGLSQ